MKKSTFNALLIGGGFLLGTAGVKAVTSAPAKRAYVQGITSPASPQPTKPRPKPLPNSVSRHSL